MSIAHHATPAAVLLTYHQEVALHGKRGALRRAGDRHGISDETVRRYVLADQAHAERADELVYVPPPGGYAEPEPLPQNATQTPQSVPQPAEAAPGEDVADPSADVADLPAFAPAVPQEPDATRHGDERQRSLLPLPQSAPRRRPRPWIDLWIEWGQTHLPAMQLLLGVVLVWLLVAVAY